MGQNFDLKVSFLSKKDFFLLSKFTFFNAKFGPKKSLFLVGYKYPTTGGPKFWSEVAGAHAACGDAAYVRNRLSEYFSAGLDQVIISGIADPDEIRSTLRALL